MRLSILIVCVFTALWGAEPAAAGWRMERAVQIADVVWHNPCGGHAQIVWSTAVNAEGGLASVNMDECRIYMAQEHQPWPLFCSLVLHEMGHLAGYHDPTNTTDPDHSSNPRSVMFASMNGDRGRVVGRTGPGPMTYLGADRRCAHRGRDFLLGHMVIERGDGQGG